VARPPKAKTLGTESLGKRQELVFGYVKTYGTATRCRIEFGRTKAYGSYAYDFEHPYGYNEGSYAEVEALAAHLQPDTTYHYRVVGWNEAGKSFGKDMTFHTGRRSSAT
jgi:hypothetical protein